SLARLKQIEKMETDGSINDYVKQEQSMIRRECARLVKNLDGVRTMEQQPDAMFIVDIKREHNAVAEGRRLGIPIVAIVDTNADPDLVDYPIAANDDAIRSLRLILTTITNSVQSAKAEFEAKNARRKRDEEEKRQAQADAKAEAAAAPAAPAAEAQATATA
ncbi:MAG: 30S ribosomal protein S2, partial [Verrucomicrobiota bacterium]